MTTIRREMWNKARDESLAQQRPAYCQRCWTQITDGHSRYLHAHCAQYLHGDVYRTVIERRALEQYDKEEHDEQTA